MKTNRLLLVTCLSFLPLFSSAHPVECARALWPKSVLQGFLNTRRYKTEWNCAEPECTVDVRRVGDLFPTLQPEVSHKSVHLYFIDDENDGPYNFGSYLAGKNQLPAEIYTFRVPLLSGEEHVIEVILPPDFALPRSMSNLELVTRIVKSLPIQTIKATKKIEIIPRADLSKHSPVGLTQAFADAEGNVHLSTALLSQTFDEEISILLHEHGHNVGAYVFHNFFDIDALQPGFWRAAINRDGQDYVSDYAQHCQNLREDFAETFRLYLESNAGSLDTMTRQKFASRFRALDLLFSKEKGGLTSGGFWDSVRNFNQSKEDLPLVAFGSAMGVACLGVGAIAVVYAL